MHVAVFYCFFHISHRVRSEIGGIAHPPAYVQYLKLPRRLYSRRNAFADAHNQYTGDWSNRPYVLLHIDIHHYSPYNFTMVI